MSANNIHPDFACKACRKARPEFKIIDGRKLEVCPSCGHTKRRIPAPESINMNFGGGLGAASEMVIEHLSLGLLHGDTYYNEDDPSTW